MNVIYNLGDYYRKIRTYRQEEIKERNREMGVRNEDDDYFQEKED